MRILITGGSGFIGSHLVDYLLDKSGHEIVVLSRSLTPLNLERHWHNVKLKIVKCDLQNEDAISLIIEGLSIDLVYHLYWTTMPRANIKELKLDLNKSLNCSLELLNACVKSGVKKIVFASSAGTVYGNTFDLPVKENATTNPISAYGITKLMFEQYLKLYKHNFNLEYTILRIANAYGPRQNLQIKQGVIAHWMDSIIKNNEVVMFGSPETTRDYVYIDDVIQSLILSLKSKESDGQTINISSNEETSLQRIVEILREVVGSSFKCKVLNLELKSDVSRSRIDNSSALGLLSWKPTISLANGIKQTWNFMNKKMLIKKNINDG